MQSTTTQEATMFKSTATHLYVKAVSATAALASLALLCGLVKVRY